MYLRSMTAHSRPVLRLVPRAHCACCTFCKMDWHAARFENSVINITEYYLPGIHLNFRKLVVVWFPLK